MSDLRVCDIAKRAEGSVNAVRSGASRAMDDVIPALEDAARTAAATLRDVSGRASSLLSELRDSVPDTRDQMAGRVRAQPLTAVLVAAGVGLLTGLILSRRSSGDRTGDDHA